MGISYNTTFIFLLVLSVTYNVNAQIFDISKYGGKGGGASDSSQGLLNAWKAACASPRPAELLIPKGVTYLVKNANLQGPCKAPTITINLQGTLKAPADPSQQSKNDDWISFYNVKGLTIHGGGYFDGSGQTCWRKKLAKQIGFMVPNSLGLNYVTNVVIQNIHSINAKMFHMKVFASKDVTFRSVTIIAPYESPNTDGIHIGRSSDVKVLGCSIRTGDDCVSIGDGSKQVLIQNVHCGPGHGIAVGSLGKYSNEEPVTGIIVKSSTLTNTENGLRVKTFENTVKGYTASDIHFEDITLTNVTYPINIDQQYCPTGNCAKNASPSKIKIDKLTFKGIKGTSSTSQIIKLVCSKSNPCSNVELSDINIVYHGRKGEDTIILSNVNPKLSGTQIPKIK